MVVEADFSFEDALLSAIRQAPVRPAFMEYYDPREPKVVAELDRMEAVNETFRTEVAERFSHGTKRVEQIRNYLKSREVSSDDIDKLTKTAAAVEHSCVLEVVHDERMSKSMRRSLRDVKRDFPKLATRIDRIFRSFVDLAREQLEGRLELALMFRGLAAEFDPDREVIAGDVANMSFEEFIAADA